MKFFEYKTEVLPYKITNFGTNMTNVETTLNEFGDNGWELINTIVSSNDRTTFIFKREKPITPIYR